MTPLTLGSAAREVPQNFPDLLDLLAGRPQPAVIWYGGAEERVELSGRVLQNWTVKLVGLLREEVDLTEEDIVLVDAAPHWKAAAAVLAAGALGCAVRLGPGRGSAEAELREPTAQDGSALVVTDRPLLWAESEALGDAELAALSPGLLDGSYQEATDEELPSWALDVSADVRQHPDQLIIPLEAHPLPSGDERPGTHGGRAPGADAPPAGETPAEGAPALVVTPAGRGAMQSAGRPESPRWIQRPWQTAAVPEMLRSWAHSGTVVLWGGALGREAHSTQAHSTQDQSTEAQRWAAMLRNEGLS